VDDEMQQFCDDLLQSVREMKAGEVARSTGPTEAALARRLSGLSQTEFARLLGVSTRTLQQWEQGRRQPSGAARMLLRIAIRHPDVLREACP